MSVISRQTKTAVRRWAKGLTVLLAVAAAGGCDQLLDVSLPADVTSDALEAPGSADVQVNSVIALIECAYGGMTLGAAGYEDNFQRTVGSAGTFSEYPTAGGGSCSNGFNADGFTPNVFLARGLGYDVYNRILGWSQEAIASGGGLGAYGSKDRLLATVALYLAIDLDIAGEHYCEFAITTADDLAANQSGPMLTYSQTLDVAVAWADSALARIASGGDYAITLASGTITSSAETLAHGIKARALWAKGSLSEAATEADKVPDGFYAFVTRDDDAGKAGRYNTTDATIGGGDGGTQVAQGFMQGPVKLNDATHDEVYGVSELGNNPVTGDPWPNPVPFTGYIDLAINSANGRAVDADGYPLTLADAGTVADPRVTLAHGLVSANSGTDYISTKYTSLGDDIPLLNWMEMRLIQAEANPGTAVQMVNRVRHGMAYISGETLVQIDLPDVTYNPTGDEIDDMIIEERRRALWMEARFWSTKILNPDKLWFPRGIGTWANPAYSPNLGGGVRVLLENAEYELNENLGLAARGTGCPADQAPVGF